LARSDIWRDRIGIYTTSGVSLDWAIIRPKVCIYATDDMDVQLHGLLQLAICSCKDHDLTYIMELDRVSQGGPDQAKKDAAMINLSDLEVPKTVRYQLAATSAFFSGGRYAQHVGVSKIRTQYDLN